MVPSSGNTLDLGPHPTRRALADFSHISQGHDINQNLSSSNGGGILLKN
jgi:hypothetical protein